MVDSALICPKFKVDCGMGKDEPPKLSEIEGELAPRCKVSEHHLVNPCIPILTKIQTWEDIKSLVFSSEGVYSRGRFGDLGPDE